MAEGLRVATFYELTDILCFDHGDLLVSKAVELANNRVDLLISSVGLPLQ
jgi:hypothetical protein